MHLFELCAMNDTSDIKWFSTINYCQRTTKIDDERIGGKFIIFSNICRLIIKIIQSSLNSSVETATESVWSYSRLLHNSVRRSGCYISDPNGGLRFACEEVRVSVPRPLDSHLLWRVNKLITPQTISLARSHSVQFAFSPTRFCQP
jgi:hypothetical protein